MVWVRYVKLCGTPPKKGVAVRHMGGYQLPCKTQVTIKRGNRRYRDHKTCTSCPEDSVLVILNHKSMSGFCSDFNEQIGRCTKLNADDEHQNMAPDLSPSFCTKYGLDESFSFDPHDLNAPTQASKWAQGNLTHHLKNVWCPHGKGKGKEETITGCDCHHEEPRGKGKGKDGCDRRCCLHKPRVVPKCAVAKWTACESDRPKQGEPGDQLGQMPRQRCQVKKSIRCMAICKYAGWDYTLRRAKVRDCNKKLCEKTGPVVCTKAAMMM